MERLPLDENGQPPYALNRVYRREREIDELLGICKGVLADGIVCEAEVAFLNAWVKHNPEVASRFPGSIVADRLRRIYADKVVTEEERLELCEVIKEIVGQSDEIEIGESGSVTALFEDPEPDIVIPAHAFSFTGKFVSGTRKWCVDQILSRGGAFHEIPKYGTHFLVVGTCGSRDWKHSSYGNKLEKAMDYRDKYRVRIVSEEHWLTFVC